MEIGYVTDQMDDECGVCDTWMSQMDDELTDDGRMDDGGWMMVDIICVTDRHRQTQTQTHEHLLVDTSWFAAPVSQ